MALAWCAPCGRISSTLEWKQFFPMAFFHDMGPPWCFHGAPPWCPPCGGISFTLDWTFFLAWRSSLTWCSHGAVCGRVSLLLEMEPNFSHSALPWHGAPMALHHGALHVEILFNIRMDTISTMAFLYGMALPWRPHGALQSISVVLHYAICIFMWRTAIYVCLMWRPATRL